MHGETNADGVNFYYHCNLPSPALSCTIVSLLVKISDCAIHFNFGHNRVSGVKCYILKKIQFRHHRTQFYMYNNRVALIQALAPNCEYKIIFLFALNSSYTLYHNTSSFYMSYSPYPSHTHIVCIQSTCQQYLRQICFFIKTDMKRLCNVAISHYFSSCQYLLVNMKYLK